MFQLRLLHRCDYPEVASSCVEQWEPDVRRLLQRTDPVLRRNTIALILEAIHDHVESQALLHVRRHGRWLLGLWVRRFQREVGGLVLDYYETRSPEEMLCFTYVYTPIAFDEVIASQAERHHRNDELPCADQTEGGPVDARIAYDKLRSWSLFTPPDAWQWN